MREDFREALEELKSNSSFMIEVAFSIAKFNRAYFEALVDQGFSEEEALELLKVHGINLKGN